MVFASPRSSEGTFLVDPSGYLLWQQFICYYLADLDGHTLLFRKALSVQDEGFASPPQVPPITLKDTNWFAASSIPQKKVASDIKSLEISGAAPVALTLAVERNDWGKKFEVGVQVKVFLRN